MNVLKLHFLFKTSVYIFIYHSIAADIFVSVLSLYLASLFELKNVSRQAVAFILPLLFFLLIFFLCSC